MRNCPFPSVTAIGPWLGATTCTCAPEIGRFVRRLEQNAHARPTPEHARQALARRRDPSVDNLAILRQDSNLAFLLVKVDGTILHGWSSPCALRARSARVGAQATTSLRRPAAS